METVSLINHWVTFREHTLTYTLNDINKIKPGDIIDGCVIILSVVKPNKNDSLIVTLRDSENNLATLRDFENQTIKVCIEEIVMCIYTDFDMYYVLKSPMNNSVYYFY